MEEKEIKNDNVVTDDELYAKIETEKMLKSKRNKNIIMITSLALVLAVVIVVICLATIRVNLKPNFLNGTNYIAKVWIDGQEETGEMSNTGLTEKFNEFNNLLNDAMSQTYFAGLFNGSMFNYSITENKNNTLGNFKEETLKDASYVTFDFTESQTLLNHDGSVYSSRLNSTITSFKFDYVYMILNEEEGVQNIDFYVETTYSRIDGDGEEVDVGLGGMDGWYVIKITTQGDTSALFDRYDPNSENE